MDSALKALRMKNIKYANPIYTGLEYKTQKKPRVLVPIYRHMPICLIRILHTGQFNGAFIPRQIWNRLPVMHSSPSHRVMKSKG